MRRYLALVLFVLVILIGLSSAQEAKPSTPEERQRAIQLAQKLEANPLNESLQPDRAWLIKWAAQAPDFTVMVCAGPAEFAKKKYKYGPDLTFQKMASGIAYVVQHPDQPKDAVAEELAAVNGALNAYEAILKVDPNKGHTEYWDSLLKKRADGTLKEFVSDYVNKDCSGSK
jgi:carboxypeptidase Q